MPRRRQRQLWVGQPRQHGRKWRVQTIGGEGQVTYESFDSEDQAKEFKRIADRERCKHLEKDIEGALIAYELYQRNGKGNKPRSVATTITRLKGFFPDQHLPLRSLTVKMCSGFYEELMLTVAVDTHRNTLNQARTFLNWCVAKEWISKNPLIHVKGEGKRVHGKPQLRIDEARRWTENALTLAEGGDARAVAALLTLYMGFRASEVIKRQVRDVDDNGRLLWIPSTKTEAGKRNVEVPEFLQKHLSKQTENKLPTALLFNFSRHVVRGAVERSCHLSGVPKVCAHSMRGLHATLAFQSGTTSHAVAASLGHHSFTTTEQSYLADGAAEGVRQKKFLSVIAGGKKRANGA